ncbi:MAG: DUF1127 domain-containing protein [Alphaproteobacteria bacterium]|nr:DUF1127 domain-containing protein [Alphaproteobacteria bacterium]
MKMIDATAALHASGQPANTPIARFPFPDHTQVERLLAAGRAARSAYMVTLVERAFRAFGHGITGALRMVRRWQVAMKTRAALERLSDYQLRDIGLTRHDVDVLVGHILAGRVIGAESSEASGPAIVLPVNRNVSQGRTRRVA